MIKTEEQLEEVLPIDNSKSEHIISLSGNNETNSYENKKSFYKHFFFKYHMGRLEDYDNYLRKHLKKEDKILSVASGRSANELLLIDEGYDIYCTDLYKFEWYNKTKRLWANYKFSTLDIVKHSSIKKYDVVLALSLIFIFNDTELNKFFKNINKSLNENGYLILDSAGSPDNFASSLIHDFLIKYEIYLIKFIKFISSFGKKNFTIIKKHHGYRRNNKEIIRIAKNNCAVV